ncbi:MAG: hypothetical protein M0Z33_01030, partial [Actinomycetota bacterium]|nr:hypothetical protein [Actinomycetota bacterium]
MAGAALADGRIAAFVTAGEPLARSALAAQLRGRHDLAVVEDPREEHVAVVVEDSVDERATTAVRALLDRGVPHVLVVATSADEAGGLAAIGAGASAVVR